MNIKLTGLFLCLSLAVSAAPDFTRCAFSLESRDRNGVSCDGSGCLVKWEGAVYYVTAHHIFGTTPDARRAKWVKSMAVVGERDKSIRFVPEKLMHLAHVKNLTRTDLMILKMKPDGDMSRYAVDLAPAGPKAGEVVYLAAWVTGRDCTTYPLTITAADKERVDYKKVPSVDKYTGASGGPIFNENGQLTGTYTGHTLKPDGSILGLFGTPYAALRQALTECATKK